MNTYQLKLIAIFTMLIDHIGATFFPEFNILRIIGRIAFPIFCFLIVEGYFHTSDVKKYIGRLFLFAIISEIPFDLAFFHRFPYYEHQNVFFTLFVGLLTITLIDKWARKISKSGMLEIPGVVVLILGMFAAMLIRSDYQSYGVLLILIFYLYRDYSKMKLIIVAVATIVLFYGSTQVFSLISIIPILYYNGKKGRSVKYLFYVFYPLHLLIIFAVYQLML